MFEQSKTDETESSGEVHDASSSSPSPTKNDPSGVEFDGYISVSSSDDGSSLLELPVDDDGTLSIATLSHSFPEALGLKFKNPSTGVFRTLAVDEQKRCICPPKGGWGTRRYVAIFAIPSGDRKRPCNDDMGDLVGEKRSGLDGCLNESMRVPVDLIVLNLSFKTNEETLKKFFEQYGEVQYVEIKRDFKTNMPKGYGFVKFANIDSQDKVLREREVFLDGRVAQVKLPNHHPNKTALAPSPIHMEPQPTVLSTKLYVGRVWNTLTEQDLYDAFEKEAKKFSPLAKIERVFIPKPHRGFAFVTVNDPNVTKRLCQIRDFIICGKSVCVSIPTPKTNNNNTLQQMQMPMQQQFSSQQQQQQQKQLSAQDLFPNRYQMPPPATPQQASMQSFSTSSLNYTNQFAPPQQQNWMNQRVSTYRGTGAPPPPIPMPSFSHDYGSLTDFRITIQDLKLRKNREITVHLRRTTRLLVYYESAPKKAPKKARKKASKKASEKAPEKAPEKIEEKVPEKASEKAPEKALEKVPEKAPKKAPKKYKIKCAPSSWIQIHPLSSLF